MREEAQGWKQPPHPDQEGRAVWGGASSLPLSLILTSQFATVQVFHGKGLAKPGNSDVDPRGVGYPPGGFIVNHSVSPKGGSRENTIIILGCPLPIKTTFTGEL